MNSGGPIPDPLHGISFTPEELRETIDMLTGNIMAAPAEADITADGMQLATALGAFTIISEMAVRSTEEARIELETFTSSIASQALGHLLETRGNTPLRSLLSPFTKTPKLDKKHQEEAAAKLADKKEQIASKHEEIQTTEKKYLPTANQLRQFRYKAEGKERNGTWLEQSIIDVTDNGSSNKVFSDTEARFLTGLSIGDRSSESIVGVKTFISSLSKMHTSLQRLGGVVPLGLFTAVGTLRELYEISDPKLINSPHLQPLIKFAELFFAEQEVLVEDYINTLEEGPFAHCPELPFIPFDAKSVDPLDRKGSLVAIPEDDFNEENILNDIKVAVNRSGNRDIIMPERVEDFISLYHRLVRTYGAEHVSRYRSLRPKWHQLPWYLITIDQPNDPPIAVLECPANNNAGYYINNGDWRGTVGLSRTDARKVQASPTFHLPGPDGKPVSIENKLFNKVRIGYKG